MITIDRAYDSVVNRGRGTAASAQSVIKPWAAGVPPECDPDLCRERNLVGRSRSGEEHCCRVATPRDKQAGNHPTFLRVACVVILLKWSATHTT